MGASLGTRVQPALDQWNREVEQPIRDLRYPVLSDVATFDDVESTTLLASVAVSYRVELRTEAEVRHGPAAPKLAFDALSTDDCLTRLPDYRPLPDDLTRATVEVESQRWIIGVDPEQCHTCHATGQVDCPTCKGRKQLPCAPCKGTGQRSERRTKSVVCAKCQGHGYLTVPCTQCDQRGWSPCSLCERDGYVRTYGSHPDGSPKPLTAHECTACGGSHRRTCATCAGGGRQRGPACPTVQPVSYDVTVGCAPCHGSGRVDCRSCVARGTVMCRTCDGFRTLYRCKIAHRAAVSTPLGSWRAGKSLDLVADGWIADILQSPVRRHLFEIRSWAGEGAHPALSSLIESLQASSAPYLDEIRRSICNATRHSGDTVLVASVRIPAVTFTARVDGWEGHFIEPEHGTVFASTAIAPTSPEQKLRQEKAYAAWRPAETAVRQAAYEAAVIETAKRRAALAEAARRAIPWRRAGVVALLSYFALVVAAWAILVGVGIRLDDGYGVIRRVDPFYGWLILVTLGVLPAFLGRRRIARFVVSGVAAFRPFVAPFVADPALPETLPETVPSDWRPSMHQAEPTQTDSLPTDRVTAHGLDLQQSASG